MTKTIESCEWDLILGKKSGAVFADLIADGQYRQVLESHISHAVFGKDEENTAAVTGMPLLKSNIIGGACSSRCNM